MALLVAGAEDGDDGSALAFWYFCFLELLVIDVDDVFSETLCRF